jgi:hypothetical protein
MCPEQLQMPRTPLSGVRILMAHLGQETAPQVLGFRLLSAARPKPSSASDLDAIGCTMDKVISPMVMPILTIVAPYRLKIHRR